MTSLDGLIVGARLTKPGLKRRRAAARRQFVVYSVPDDIAATLDCEKPVDAGRFEERQAYLRQLLRHDVLRRRPEGRAGGAVVGARKTATGRSCPGGSARADDAPAPAPIAEPKVARIPGDPSLAIAARDFLESWLVKKRYDAAFAYLSPQSYGCYDLERDPALPRQRRRTTQAASFATRSHRRRRQSGPGADSIR